MTTHEPLRGKSETPVHWPDDGQARPRQPSRADATPKTLRQRMRPGVPRRAARRKPAGDSANRELNFRLV